MIDINNQLGFKMKEDFSDQDFEAMQKLIKNEFNEIVSSDDIAEIRRNGAEELRGIHFHIGKDIKQITESRKGGVFTKVILDKNDEGEWYIKDDGPCSM